MKRGDGLDCCRRRVTALKTAPHPGAGADGEYGYELAASLARAGWVVYAGCSTAGGFQRVRKEVEIMEAALKAG